MAFGGKAEAAKAPRGDGEREWRKAGNQGKVPDLVLASPPVAPMAPHGPNAQAVHAGQSAGSASGAGGEGVGGHGVRKAPEHRVRGE